MGVFFSVTHSFVGDGHLRGQEKEGDEAESAELS